MPFKIVKDNKKKSLFYCSKCNSVFFDTIKAESQNPIVIKKKQILDVKFKCFYCYKEYNLKHTKIFMLKHVEVV